MLLCMLGSPTRDRRSERRQATKAEILEAAWDIVREEGVGGLNLRNLAQRLGMRAPSLYEYFPSKHAIYDAMFAEGYRQFDAIVAELVSLSGQDGLRAAARRTVAFMVDEPAILTAVSKDDPWVHPQS